MNRGLRFFLIISGIYLIFLLPLSFYFLPAQFRWRPYNTMYEHMLIAIYGTIGVFLLLASADLDRYWPFLWFLVWVNLAHGSVMAIDAFATPSERTHLLGDVPLTFGWGLVLGILIWSKHGPTKDGPCSRSRGRERQGAQR